MKSRTSCCNRGLILRDLRRTALLWVGYLLLWFVAMPATLYASAEWMGALDMRIHVLEFAADVCHLASAFYGAVVAWFLFSYLYKSRSANFFGALPLRRETQFLSHYGSGLLCSIVPNLVICCVTAAAGASLGADLVKETAVWFAAHSLTFLFYFSFAVLCAMLVGNMVAMPVLYVILNFVAVVVESMVRSLMESMLFGISVGHEMLLDWLSPLYYFPMDSNGPHCRRIFEEVLVDCTFEGWTELLILGAVGVVLAAVSFFLYKSRRMESAGDVIAVKRLRPVFLYVFTFGCALVAGMFLSNILVQDMNSSYFLPQAACLLAAAAVGHFLGHMILQRSLRVFCRKNFRSCGICLAVLIVILGAMKLDVFGIVGYVPEQAEVAGVRLEGGVHDVEDPQRIGEVIALHQEILARQDETEDLCRRSNYKPMVDLVYVLKDGREVRRSYRMPMTDENCDDPDLLLRKYDAINNTPEMILSRHLPETEITRNAVENCVIYYYNTEMGDGHVRLEPNSQEAVELWENAILKDLRAGNMGQSYYADNYRSAAEITAAEPTRLYSEVYMEFHLVNAEDENEYCHFSIPDTAVHTKATLVEMGVPEEAFAVKAGK